MRRELLDYQRNEMKVHPDSARLSRGLPAEPKKPRKASSINSHIFSRTGL